MPSSMSRAQRVLASSHNLSSRSPFETSTRIIQCTTHLKRLHQHSVVHDSQVSAAASSWGQYLFSELARSDVSIMGWLPGATNCEMGLCGRDEKPPEEV
jgi:hypothetical protein